MYKRQAHRFCFKAGIPEEEAVRQTLMHYYREADEPLVRLTLHNLYECRL